MNAYYFIVLAVMIGASWAQVDTTTIDQPEPFSLPPGLEGHKEAIDAMKGEVFSAIQKRCEKYGGPDAFEKYNSVGHEFGECIGKLVSREVLQQEVEAGKKNGSVDEVFKKYCEKKPQFEECIVNAAETAKVCLSPEEQVQLKTVKVVAEELAKFICFKDGDRIALFIADGGPECFQAHREELYECANQTLGVTNVTNNIEGVLDIISFEEEQCNQITAFQKCAVKSMEQCERPTTANIVESLFKFAKQSTPCKNFTVAQRTNAAVAQSAVTATIISFVFAILLFNV